MSDLAQRALPSPLRVDQDGALRVIAHPVTFERFMARGFGALAQYAAGDMIAALRFVRALGEVSLDCDDPERLACIRHHLDALEALASEKLKAGNLAQVRERSAAIRRALADPDHQRRLRDDTAALGGTA